MSMSESDLDFQKIFEGLGVSDVDQVDAHGDPVNPEPEPEPQPEPTPEPTPEPEPQPAPEPTPDKPVETPPEPAKPVQTPEENAKFAEMRRQQQLEQKKQEWMAEIKKSDPAYQVLNTLTEMYGLPPEQIAQQLQEARIQQQAKSRNVPVEVIKEIESAKAQTTQLQQQIQQIQFTGWVNRMNAEKAQVQQSYPFLSEQEISDAMSHMLTNLKNTNLPLEQAVWSLHGSKIAEKLRESARQEALAEISGRKPSTLPPQGGATKPKDVELSEDEKAVARAMGISEADWIKYK